MKILMSRFMNALKDISKDAKEKFNRNIISEQEYTYWKNMWLKQANKLITEKEEEREEYKKQDNQACVLECEKQKEELIKERDEHMQLLTDL